MSLKSKIEAVIYASEEPVTLPQLAGLLGEEAFAELEAFAAQQAPLPLQDEAATGSVVLEAEATAEQQQTVEAEPSSVPQEATTEKPGEASSAEASVSATGTEAAEIPDAEAAQDTTETEAIPDPKLVRERERRVREHIRRAIDTLIREYAESDRGIEIREVAGGFRMGTKPEYHDAVRGFVRSLKPALKLTLQALETLAVVAYKQPVTAAEISEIRGVDSAGVLGGLMGRKLIATAGRKQVIGRPMLYKTTKEFLVRFGLRDVHELPSMEEFERLAGELNEQEDLPMEPTAVVIERANARGDADHIREVTGATEAPEQDSEAPVSAEDPSEAEAPQADNDGSATAVQPTASPDSESTTDTPAGSESQTRDTPSTGEAS